MVAGERRGWRWIRVVLLDALLVLIGKLVTPVSSTFLNTTIILLLSLKSKAQAKIKAENPSE